MSGEWIDWHRGYDRDTGLASRLEIVQRLIRETLDEQSAGAIRVISLCAGDGRDLLGVLRDHPRRDDVRARLVELEPELAAAGRQQALNDRLAGVDFRHGDASVTSAYAGAVPADLVVACGIFGNITDGDVRNTIDQLPRLCGPRATVIWTRGRFEPDLTPTIRTWFAAAGFAELAFVPVPESTATVGANRLEVEPGRFRPDQRLFTFLEKESRPSFRGGAPRVPSS